MDFLVFVLVVAAVGGFVYWKNKDKLDAWFTSAKAKAEALKDKLDG